MSNPWAVVGLTYDAQSLQTDDFTLYLWIRKGLNEVPTVRGDDYIVPARAGRIEMNRVNDLLYIELFGQVTSDPAATDVDTAKAGYRTLMRSVRALFASKRERADLVATLENGDVLSISARPMNVLVPEEVEGVYASLSVELEGYDDWTEVGS